MEDEYRKVTDEFYRIYRPLQKKYNLREHSKFGVNIDGKIEIWEYEGNLKKKLICIVNESDIVECYKKAIDDLKYYAATRKEITRGADLAS